MTVVRVRVPATSANLGPGFDAFGVALPLVADFEARPARSWGVTVEGDGAGIPTGEDNLFVVAAHAVAAAARASLPAAHVTQRSAIPLARGLGSSAAAVVGGALAANALLGDRLDRRSLLRVAGEVEGHADNVAAALYGAFTICLPTDEGPLATRLPFPSAWRVCLFVPSATLATETARAVLPAEVARCDAVFNLAHAAALVAAVLRADGALLSVAMADRLHEPARAALVPALHEVVGAARGAGAFGAALSGAGPAILAIAPARLAPRVVAAMEEAAQIAGAAGRARMLRVRAAGASVQRS
ncbi:MAG TPA: homoserine kinase [Candidatus Limnocylindria bacterium]|nr:homoserine kinase [Candidatus Limnocylindria bacterium]